MHNDIKAEGILDCKCILMSLSLVGENLTFVYVAYDMSKDGINCPKAITPAHGTINPQCYEVSSFSFSPGSLSQWTCTRGLESSTRLISLFVSAALSFFHSCTGVMLSDAVTCWSHVTVFVHLQLLQTDRTHYTNSQYGNVFACLQTGQVVRSFAVI